MPARNSSIIRDDGRLTARHRQRRNPAQQAESDRLAIGRDCRRASAVIQGDDALRGRRECCADHQGEKNRQPKLPDGCAHVSKPFRYQMRIGMMM
jgi:hypothetical protein